MIEGLTSRESFLFRISPARRLCPAVLGGALLAIGAAPVIAETAGDAGEAATPRQELDSAWQQASRFLFRDAHEGFNAMEGGDAGEARMRRLGLAVTTLGLQPRTQRNIQRAELQLRALIDENPSDFSGRFARFYLARLLETHATTPDPEAARELYYQLLLEQPGHPMLELAASRIAYNDLYTAGADPGALAAAELSLRPLAELLQTPAGRREFHTAVAFTLNELGGDPQTALDHALIAAEIPNPLPQMQSTNLLLAAGLAAESGRTELARHYYTRFVSEFQRDGRNYSVRKILETMPSGPEESTTVQPAHGTDS